VTGIPQLLMIPEQFQENCAAIFRPELRENKYLERFSDLDADPGLGRSADHNNERGFKDRS
jgi:hypothetical protein